MNLETEKTLLLMGPSRSGKTSIANVVFKKMQPNDTLFLDSTLKITKSTINSFIKFQVWDFPTNFDSHSTEIYQNCGALVFVIDAQDDFLDALQKLLFTVIQAHKYNPKIAFEVFIHKVDGLSDDHKIDIQREIHQRIMDELLDAGMDQLHLGFHLTSIYDHSVFEAFSKVVQKLVIQLPTLENLLNILCSNSGIEKIFLFDIQSKIYLATDSSPVDMQSYELCSDMIDIISDMTFIYDKPVQKQETDQLAVIHLDNGMVLYFCPVNEQLALVSLIRKENFEKQGLIDYNFGVIAESIQSL